MSYLKASYLLSDETQIPPFVLGAFLSRSIFKGNYIYTESSFREGDYSEMAIGPYKNEYLLKLNFVSSPFSWQLVNTVETAFKAKLFIENDLNLSKERFFYQLYLKIIKCPWNDSSNNLTDEKKSFIRGFMEIRGSIDATANYVSQDYFYDDEKELKKYKILVDACSIPYYVLNINFRNLQKQYYEDNKKRNTQFRLNSRWYMKNIGMYNDYKIDVYANTHSSKDKIIVDGLLSYFDIEEPKYNLNKGIDNKFNFYLHNILHKQLSEEEILSLRKNLGYDSSTASVRDSSLAELVRLLDPDECVCCKNLYDINDRTFTHKRTNRPYFEVHHVISLGDNKELDDENNLVKLCPVCHSCLKRGTGIESEQKHLIGLILENSSKALNFSKNIFNCDDLDILIDKIYANLK